MLAANRDPADYGENRGRGKPFLSTPVRHLTFRSHRMRGPREENCP